MRAPRGSRPLLIATVGLASITMSNCAGGGCVAGNLMARHIDGSVSGGTDAGTDAGRDASSDASSDSGSDAGPDAASDASSDAANGDGG